MIKSNPCKKCGSIWHTAAFCPQNRKPIKKVGKVTSRWLTFRREYLRIHPANHEGYRECYLQTTPLCPKWLEADQVTLDHILSRGSNRQLTYNEENMGICCTYCNNDKGSVTLEDYLEKKVKQNVLTEARACAILKSVNQ